MPEVASSAGPETSSWGQVTIQRLPAASSMPVTEESSSL